MYSNWLNKYIEPKFSNAVIDTAIITGLCVFLGYWFSTDSPLFSVQGFTWLILGPMLSGLRYGFIYALSSVLLIIGLLFAMSYQSFWAKSSLPSMGLALLIIAYVSGEFGNYWKRKLKKLEALVSDLTQCLTQTDNARYILEESHQKLEQLVVTQSSLRDYIVALRKQVTSTNLHKDQLSELGPVILRILSDQGGIQEASLFAVNKDQVIKPEAICSIGNPASMDVNNPLVAECISTKKTIAIDNQLINEHGYYGTILLAIPLADAFGNLWGIISVNKIPFLNYRPEKIRLISILADFFGDLLGFKITHVFPKIRDEKLRYFVLEIQRCIQNIADYKIPSSIISIEFRNPQNLKSMKDLFLSNKRCLDQSWEGTNQKGNYVLLLLLPMTSSDEVDFYKSRFAFLLKDRFSAENFEAADILFFKHDLLPTDKALCVAYKMLLRHR